MKKYLYLLPSFLLTLPAIVHATNIQGTDKPLLSGSLKNESGALTEAFRGSAGFKDVDLPELVATLVAAFLSLLAVIFIILVIYGGYVWLMAKGNEQEVDKAKAILRQSIIGLIVVMSSYAIGYFVLYWLSTAGTGEGRPYGS